MGPRTLVITPGDPLGIGPEVTFRALAERSAEGKPVDAVLVGDGEPLFTEAERAGVPVTREERTFDGKAYRVVVPPAGEPPEVGAVRWSVQRLLEGQGAALVTGPIHKGRLAAQGFRFSGHTDFLGHLCGVQRPVMAFAGGSLMVALVTVHVPLREVPERLTEAGVLHVLRTADQAMREQLGIKPRRIAVCGLNPHAGEGGLLGHEDDERIAPAVRRARQDGIDAHGPVSAEAAFRQAADGHAEMVVAMYHDQGLAPLKLVDFGRSVNWTLGLPILRTSVDHGTADDIAGTGQADPSSMHAAIRWAERLVERAQPV